MIDGYYNIYNTHNHIISQNIIKSNSKLFLKPLSEEILQSSVLNDINNSNEWDFYLLERKDINAAVEATIKTFYTPRLILNINGMSGLERIFWTSVINTFQSLDKSDYYNNVFLGFITRSGKRLQYPSLEISSDSLILSATPKGTSDIAGLVEILLEKPEGNIAPSIQLFKFPINDMDEPYLCNLCVLPEYRRRKLGTILCSISEKIAQKYWKRNKMYLHVEDSNNAALAMYLGMGYKLTPGLSKLQSKLQGMDKIQYYKKNFDLEDNNKDNDDDNDDEDFFAGLLSQVDYQIASNLIKFNGKY